MTEDKAPLEDALAHYAITPDTLWVVFFSDPVETDPKRMVSHGFGLSYPGEEGVKAILAIEGRPRSGFLGCFSLSGLESLLSEIQGEISQQGSRLQDSVASWLRIKRDFLIILRNNNDKVETFRCVSAYTLSGAMEKVQQEYPGHEISFGGELSDLVKLIEELRKINEEQDFKKIGYDRRDKIMGWRASTLLHANKHPDLREGFIKFGDD